jgi:hypothetical protein
MPPANPGSRTALITWTVVTSFLFVIATIFAIYFYVEGSRLDKLNSDLKAKYNGIVAEGALNSAEIALLNDLKGKPETGYSGTAMDVAMQRGDKLAKLIAGQAAQSPEVAMTSATAAMTSAQEKAKRVGLNIAPDSLLSAVNLLSDAVVQRSTEAANANANAAQATEQLKQAQANAEEQAKRFQEDLAKSQAEASAAAESVVAMTAQKDTQLQQSADDINQRLKQTQDALDKANIQIADLSTQVENKQKEVANVQDKLKEIRPDVNKPLLRQADGHIVRLPGQGICFIDLGSGDQIIPGMTFEVYDRIEGIPPPGDPGTDENLPRGKAAVEVVRVGPTSSQCRIVNVTPGATLTEGDLIYNLVYDRNTKNRFLVYGSFDLDRDGRATPQEGEVIKRLVTQWGGEIVDNVTVNTDFVVLGKEPVIPTLTPEEKDDPVQRAIYDRAVQESEAYNDLSKRATDYRIPVLNQNRFLYMIGYFELASR